MEIGSDFELPVSHLWGRKLGNALIKNDGSLYYLTSSGRASIKLILNEYIKSGEGDEALLPAFLFQNLLTPFKNNNIKITFYRLNKDLSLDVDDIKAKINKHTKILYIIHYFGFPQPVQKLNWLKDNYPSCSIIEDLAQALGTSSLDKTIGSFGDFNFTVCMKYLPVPDGSILTINKHFDIINWKKEQVDHVLYVNSRYIAMNLKYLYSKTHLVPKPLYRTIFQFASNFQEKHLIYSNMSLLTQCLLEKFNYEQIFERRIQNYKYLLKRWNSSILLPLFGDISEKVCPLGFLVLANDRDIMVRELGKKGIYCPVHWRPGIKGEVFSHEITEAEFPLSRELANKIMMIPIDQRYGTKEMEYILKQVDNLV
jgi:dTDP-4-amino-4,6-dideoxygalactose transaminase